METWKPIPNFPGYEVSDLGNVASFWKYKGRGGGAYISNTLQRMLNPIKINGYLKVSLNKDNGKRYLVFVHRLVLEAFIGPCPIGMQACHNDGSRTKNSLNNLRWDSPKNNHHDRIEHKTDPIGKRNGRAKVSEEEVVQIRALASQELNQTQIGNIFSISHAQVSCIFRRKNWVHVP